MIGIIWAEFLKYKRTFTRKLIIFAPLFFVIYALPQRFLMPTDYLRPWRLQIVLVYNWWPVLFIPLGMALFAVLVETQEKKAGNYRGLRAHDVSPLLIWLGKVIVMTIHALFTTIVLIISVLISGLTITSGSIPWFEILVGGFILWVTSLAIIPIQLWAATWKGPFFGMVLGFVGMITGVIAAAESYWIYVPWSWPTRLMCPIIGVHPNGVPLEIMDPLRNLSAVPIGLTLSIIAVIITTIITAFWFSRREVK